jgi:RPA family protein
MESQQRQTAYKIKISQIHESTYVKEEGWLPNYLEIFGRLKVSRVNLLGIIVAKEKQEDSNVAYIVIDDGTGRIMVRSFDEKKLFDNLNVGDIANVIGRPREYNNEKYVIVEIIREVKNKSWLDLRKLEWTALERNAKSQNRSIQKTNNHDGKEEEEIISKEESIETESSEPESASQKIYKIIKENSNTEGIDIDKVVSISGLTDTEDIIKSLLSEGEIFEIRPGRIKILE